MTGTVFAAGSVTQSLAIYPNTTTSVLTFSFIGDASNGSVPDTAISAAILDKVEGWYIYMVDTKPGTTAPTTLYDITIENADGVDLMGGTLANRSATAAERATATIDTVKAITGMPQIVGATTIKVTNQSVASATWTMKIYLTR